MIVVQRAPGGMTEYMTLDPDYNTVGAICTWCPDPSKAFGFARRIDAENFLKKYKNWFDHRAEVGEIK